jgi:hypothetical protein
MWEWLAHSLGLGADVALAIVGVPRFMLSLLRSLARFLGRLDPIVGIAPAAGFTTWKRAGPTINKSTRTLHDRLLQQ